MNLKSRLSRLQSQAGSGFDGASEKPSVSDLRARIAQLEQHGRRKARADSLHIHRGQDATSAMPDAEQIAPGVARFCKRYPLTGRLGSTELHTLQKNPRLPGEPDTTGLRRVYIDTETTGLSGGSGTLAFLVGIAVVEDDAIALTQYLITRFAGEAAMLAAFAEALTPNDQLVSYNGKSYDLPLLATRFRMQGLRQSFDSLPHLDLLHPVRRLFSKRWNDCRLISLERKLLGFQRVDDLPGSEAPEAWFSFIRSGDDRQLRRVVEHNAQDIVSLAVVHSVLTHAIEQPRAFDVDLHGLARWLGEQDEDQARDLLHSHLNDLCEDGQRLLAHLCRRAGHWPQAVTLWEQLAARGCTDSLERLAKYHEHVSKDLAAAQQCCDRLPGDSAHEHRRQRIERKIQSGSERLNPLSSDPSLRAS